MCSGKSTLGEALARALHSEFIDLDDYIERSRKRTIADIFSTEGETAFRQIENTALDEILTRCGGTDAVIALGGGTPCRPGVMDKLNSVALTVHLTTTVERFVERLMLGGDKRPLATGKDARELTDMVEEMLKLRNPFYNMASATFDSTYLEDEKQVTESVTAFIKSLL